MTYLPSTRVATPEVFGRAVVSYDTEKRTDRPEPIPPENGVKRCRRVNSIMRSPPVTGHVPTIGAPMSTIATERPTTQRRLPPIG